MAEPVFDVFLSHNSEDKAWVQQLKQDLQDRFAISAWMDADEIRGGVSWRRALEKGLMQSRSMALVVTPGAVSSDWVNEEIDYALTRRNQDPDYRLIPVLLQDATLSPFLQSKQWVDFRDPDGYEESLAELARNIKGDRPMVRDHSELKALLHQLVRVDRSVAPRYQFVDPRGYIHGLMTLGHHVIFGRRGSGKSVFLREVESRCAAAGIKPIVVDLEVANTDYPDVLAQILISVLNQLRAAINSELRIKDKVANWGAVSSLGKEIQFEVDDLARQASDRPESLPALLDPRGSQFDVYRELIGRWLDLVSQYEAIYVLLDDFYQVQRDYQPRVAEFLKKLFYGCSCYLKIATIPARTRLATISPDGRSIGLQLGRDYTRVDVDYALGEFEAADRFLTDLFANICRQSADAASCEVAFENVEVPGLRLLTAAAGGNPRSFIILLTKLLELGSSATRPISRQDIRHVSLEDWRRRRDEAQDAESRWSSLKLLLDRMVEFCQDRRDIAFCVAKRDLETHIGLKDCVAQLVDLRFVHLVEKTKLSGRGQENAVYALSAGLAYENDLGPALEARVADLRMGVSRCDRTLPTYELPL